MVLFMGGLVLSLIAIAVSTIMDGNSFGPLVGPSSLLLVILGAVGAALMAFQLSDVKRVPKATVYALKATPPDPDKTVTTMAELADVARREGMLALEAKLADVDDTFLRSGLQLVVDGLDGDQVREILEIDLNALEERHQIGIGFYKALGGYAPTFGMLGTVIGLVNMLGNLSDPSQLGIGMSMALLTTLYGVFFANLVFLPLAGRLQRLHEVELSAREMVIDGLLALQAGASPRVLVERLETYLAPAQRIGHKARSGAAPAAKAAA
jgi:chemotaxis protein MotA